MRCAIYGAGSLGTVLGAYLTKNGQAVDLINRNVAHVEALNQNGAQITGTVEMNVPVHAILPDQMEGTYDLIFLLTKQLQNPSIAAFLKPFLSKDGVLVTLQNGIPEPGLVEVLGTGRVIGCVVEWGATLTGPGNVTLTSSPDSLSFHMGRMDGITDTQMENAKTVLEKMCPVIIEENLLGVRWSKLLINATFSGLGTAIGGTFGDVSETKEMKDIAVACMKECIDVGHAAGVEFAPVQGKNITKLFYYRSPFKKALAKLILPIAMKKHREIEPSMLQDLKKQKPCEIDAINGIICSFGKKNAVPTPINDRIVEVIKKIESGELKPSKENIALFSKFR